MIRRLVAAALGVAAMGMVISVTSAGAASDPVGGGSTAPSTMAPGPGPRPVNGASLGTWQAWAARQTKAMEETPWAQVLAAQGKELLAVTYLPVGQIPGTPIPPGVTTTAVAVTFKVATPGTVVTPQAGGCAAITNGTACISSTPYTGGYEVDASYVYASSGSIVGHVEMGIYGCPGTLVENGPNSTFTYGVGQSIYYGPAFGSAEWSSTFWYDYGGGYSDWGSACSQL